MERVVIASNKALGTYNEAQNRLIGDWISELVTNLSYLPSQYYLYLHIVRKY